MILDALEHSFGKVDAYLFGSRIDDTKHGDDIDLVLLQNSDAFFRDEIQQHAIKLH